MELLLLLTALFASLTGGSTGQRAPVDSVAVVQAARVTQAAVQPARRALPTVAVQPAPAIERIASPLPYAAPISSTRSAPERRRE